MPRLRPDAIFVPKVSWTQGKATTAVSYGALVGTPSTILLLPRSGTESAGFTLTLRWTRGGATLDDIARLVSDQSMAIGDIEATLAQGLPQWQTRCVYPVAQLSRFEILSGWKLWLGVSAVLRVGDEPPTSLRVPDKGHLGEMREVYGNVLT